jgi:hypothetical protein
MDRMSHIDPTIPPQVARVHPLERAARPLTVTPLRRTDGVSAATLVRGGPERLVAGAVPGGIDFSVSTPVPSGPAIPMYRHPADRNAAAVSIHAGRMIDINA